MRDSHQGLLGLASLSDTDRKKVREGNFQYRSAVRIIRACVRLGIPGYLENPRGSRVFLTPGIQRLLREGLIWFCDFDQCQYGVPYQKTTRLLVWGVPPEAFSLARCGGPRGFCSATGKRHIQLSGQNPDKTFRTQAAQTYPWDLAKAIVAAFAPFVVQPPGAQLHHETGLCKAAQRTETIPSYGNGKPSVPISRSHA